MLTGATPHVIGHSPGKERLVEGSNLAQYELAVSACLETQQDMEVCTQPSFSNGLVDDLDCVFWCRLELLVGAEGVASKPVIQGEFYASKLGLFVFSTYSCSISSSSFAHASCSPCMCGGVCPSGDGEARRVGDHVVDLVALFDDFVPRSWPQPGQPVWSSSQTQD